MVCDSVAAFVQPAVGQVTSYCVLLIKLIEEWRDGWIDGWVGDCGTLPPHSPITRTHLI